MALALSCIGTIYGFVLTGGPIIWGLIGLVSGAMVGFIIDYFIDRKQIISKLKKGKGGEVMVIIQCSEEKVQEAKSILFDHFTLGVSVVDLNAEHKTLSDDNSPNDLLG